MVGVGGGLPLAIHSINSFLALSTGRVRKWDAWGGGGSGDLSVKLCSTPLSLAPPDGGARKKDHQEAWARRCLFIGAGAVLEGDGPQKPGQDPCPQLFPPAGDTLSQGHLFHQLLQQVGVIGWGILPSQWLGTHVQVALDSCLQLLHLIQGGWVQ